MPINHIKTEGLLLALKGQCSTAWATEYAAGARMVSALKEIGDTLQAAEEVNGNAPSAEVDPQSVLLTAVNDLNRNLGTLADALAQVIDSLRQRVQGDQAKRYNGEVYFRRPVELRAASLVAASIAGMERKILKIRKAVELANNEEIGGEEHQQVLTAQAIQQMFDKFNTIVDAVTQLLKEIEQSENVDVATGKSAFFHSKRGCK